MLNLGLANAQDEAAFREFVGLAIAELLDNTVRIPEMADVLGTMAADVHTMQSDVATIKTDQAEMKTDLSAIRTDVAVIKASIESLQSDVEAIKLNVSEIATETSTISTTLTTLEPLITNIDAQVTAMTVDVATIAATEVEIAADLVEVSASVDAIVVSTASSAATAIAFQAQWALFYSAAVGTGIVTPGSGLNVELVSLGHSAPNDLGQIDFKSVNGSTPFHVTVDGGGTPGAPQPVSISGPVAIKGIQVADAGAPPGSGQYVTLEGETVGGVTSLSTQVQGRVNSFITGQASSVSVRTGSSDYLRVYHGQGNPADEQPMPISGSVSIYTGGLGVPVDIQATGGKALRESVSGDPLLPTLGHMVSLTTSGHPIGALGGAGSGIGTDPGTVVTSTLPWTPP